MNSACFPRVRVRDSCDLFNNIRNKVVAHPRLDRRPPASTAVLGSGQDGCGTPGSSPYRCFLPDLTGFGDPSCAGPDLQRRLPRPVLRTQTSATEFGPAKADCRFRVPPAPHLARPQLSLPGLRHPNRPPQQSPPQVHIRRHRGQRNDDLRTCREPAGVLVQTPQQRCASKEHQDQHRRHLARQRVPQFRPAAQRQQQSPRQRRQQIFVTNWFQAGPTKSTNCSSKTGRFP